MRHVSSLVLRSPPRPGAISGPIAGDPTEVPIKLRGSSEQASRKFRTDSVEVPKSTIAIVSKLRGSYETIPDVSFRKRGASE
ncbi:hypothetical protein Y032_0039g109 [Ancylostoma ceylanicum]|uniref:Uncharacterized protein n=1 Tax=Ancylostoma ceylanicum TaxID=53326 RepID=A0A016UIN4_9BILA|nr:hypothetical protein Y032_0039g109 [Ancylostoma ceylanicum]